MTKCYEKIRQIPDNWNKKTASHAHPIKFFNASSKRAFGLAECRQISYDEYKRYPDIAREVLKLSIQEALIPMFTDDPINWLKWAVVFVVLIGGYAVAVPLYKKVSHGVSWERKRDIAKSRDHLIKATLVDKHPTGEVSRYNWRAVYRYMVADEERQYVAHFKHPATPPLYLYLYYVDDPDKLFSCEEYHYENHKVIFLLPVICLPWILAGLALVLLGVDVSGF